MTECMQADVAAMNEFVSQINRALPAIEAAARKVDTFLYEWKGTGKVNTRQLKLALTAHNKQVAKLGDVKLPANLRPGERELLQDALGSLDLFMVENTKTQTEKLKKQLGKLGAERAASFWKHRIDGVADSVRKMTLPNLIEKAQSFVEPSFKFGNFTVVDNHGILQRRAGYWFEVVTRASKILKQKGLDYLLYGKLVLEPVESGYNGMYHKVGDYIRLQTGEYGRPNERMLYTFVHEMGHRLWFKFLDSGARDKFAGVWVDQAADLDKLHAKIAPLMKVSPAEARQGFDQMVKTGFMPQRFQSWLNKTPGRSVRWRLLLQKVYALSLAESLRFVDQDGKTNHKAWEETRKRIAKFQKRMASRDVSIVREGLTRDQQIELAQQRVAEEFQQELGYLRESVLEAASELTFTKHDLASILEPASKDIAHPMTEQFYTAFDFLPRIEPSVTRYGQTNRLEDFAEVFAQTVLGLKKSPAIQTRLQSVLPKGRVLSETEVPMPFKVGDVVLFGKYKNKRGRIVSFGRNPKGQVTVQIDPIPKGRKKTKEMGLFKIWTTPDAIEAVAFWREEVVPVGKFLKRVDELAYEIDSWASKVDEYWSVGNAATLIRAVKKYRDALLDAPWDILRENEGAVWRDDSFIYRDSIKRMRETYVSTVLFNLEKGDIDAARNVWDKRHKRIGDPAALLREAAKSFGRKRFTEQQFSVGKFRIMDNYGLLQSEAAGWLEALDLVANMLKRKKLDFLLYGHVALQHDPARWTAAYTQSNDRLELNVRRSHMNVQPVARAIVHELGHRAWYRFMDRTQRMRFSKQWHGAEPGERKPSVTPYGTESPEEDFAETFTEVVTGKQKDRQLALRLQEALPKSRILSSVESASSRMSADEVAQILSEQPANAGKSAADLKDRWISSGTFHLMEVPIDALGIATEAKGKSSSTAPIIVDLNVREVGRLRDREGRTYGTPPEALVLDGKHRVKQAIDRGDKTIRAYVGSDVVNHLKQAMSKHQAKEREVAEVTKQYLASDTPGRFLSRLKTLLPDDEIKVLRQEWRRRRGKKALAAAKPKWAEAIESGKGTVLIGIDDGEPVEYQSWLKRYLMFSKSKQTLDVEGYSLLAPELRGVLQKLVKQYPPAAKWSVRSDGPAQPIERLLKSRGPRHGMPKHLYHGTSTALLPRIMKEGLKPRTSTSIKPTFQGGAAEGRPERVYFAAFTSLQATHFAAREAARKHGGDPIVLRIVTKPLTKRWSDFKADEDARVDDADWVRSLYTIGTIAYEGSVPPSAIRTFERLDGREWVRADANDADETEAFWRFVDKAAARFGELPEWMFHREPVKSAYSLTDIRFYEALPPYEPTAATKAVQSKLGLQPDWRALGSNRRSSSLINRGPIVIMANRDQHDTEVELHELGHFYYYTKADEAGWRRVYQYLRKTAPKWEGQNDWRNIDGHPVFVGRGRQGIEEAFADIFKLYFMKQLSGESGGYRDVMQMLTKVTAAPKLLYHGTRGPLASSIMDKGLRQDSGFSNFGGQTGVSFTRDLKVARQFGNFIVAVEPKRLQQAGYELTDVQHPTAPDEAEVRVSKGATTTIPPALFDKVLLVRPQSFEVKWWAKNRPGVKVEVLSAAEVTAFDKTFTIKTVERFRKEFLQILKNTKRLKDYRDVVQFYEACRTWGTSLRAYLDVAAKAVMDPASYAPHREREAIANQLRTNLPTRLRDVPKPLDPGSFPDETHQANVRRIADWEKEIRVDARDVWKRLTKAAQAWEELAKKYQDTSTVVPVEYGTLEKFSVKFIGPIEPKDLGKLRAALRVYRQRASKTFPWILRYQLPLVIDLYGSLDQGATYHGKYITVYELSGSSKPIEIAKTLAHEMGHHVFKTLLSHEKQKFWEAAVKGTRGPLDLRDVLKLSTSRYPGTDPAVMQSDPLMALRIESLEHDPAYADEKLNNRREIERYLAEGNDPIVQVTTEPITAYGSKNPEEAFCEALSLLVAYGPRTVLPVVQKRMRMLLPDLKVTAAVQIERTARRSDTRHPVDAAADELYHTTSLHGLAAILKSRTFKPGSRMDVGETFVSFSEKPYFGDISANDAVIVLDRSKLRNRVMRVEYTEQWYDRYPEHAGYIAGEGWAEQYVEPEECYEVDEDGWEERDDECLERARREVELESFRYKSDEREWVARNSGDLRLPAEAFKRVVVPRAKYEVVEALLRKLGLKMPVKVLRGKSEASYDDLPVSRETPRQTIATDDDEATAIETPKKWRNRTGRCPPGHRSNEKETCIDMKERRKKRRWEQQQRAKERREAGR